MTLIYLAKDTEALLAGSKDVCLEANAEEIVCTHMFVSCKHNARQARNPCS